MYTSNKTLLICFADTNVSAVLQCKRFPYFVGKTALFMHAFHTSLPFYSKLAGPRSAVGRAHCKKISVDLTVK